MNIGENVSYRPTKEQLLSLPTEKIILKAVIVLELENNKYLVRLDENFSQLRFTSTQGSGEGQFSVLKEESTSIPSYISKEVTGSRKEEPKEEESKEEEPKEEESKEDESNKEESKEEESKKKEPKEDESKEEESKEEKPKKDDENPKGDTPPGSVTRPK